MNNCVFCNFNGDSLGKIILENKYCVYIETIDATPIGSGIIITKNHRETVFDLNPIEWEATYDLMHKAKAYIDNEYNPDGYNVGWNIGDIGGQEVFHAHMHIIPRYKDELYHGKGIRHWIKQPENKTKT